MSLALSTNVSKAPQQKVDAVTPIDMQGFSAKLMSTLNRDGDNIQVILDLHNEGALSQKDASYLEGLIARDQRLAENAISSKETTDYQRRIEQLRLRGLLDETLEV